jgi:hypothetical protein
MNEMDGACSTCVGERRSLYRILEGKPEKKDTTSKTQA